MYVFRPVILAVISSRQTETRCLARGFNVQKVSMKYDFQIELEPKAPLARLDFRLDEKTVREFKYFAKQNGFSMTYVLTKMLREFVIEHRDKGKPKQRTMF